LLLVDCSLTDLNVCGRLIHGLYFRETIALHMSGADQLTSLRQARQAILLMAVASLLGSAADSWGQTTGKRVETTLRAVTMMPTKDGVSVVIEGSGPLQPSSGFANGPPRIYIDLNDVLPGDVTPSVTQNPLVRRIRVAEHSSRPLVTRVVIDLTRALPYRVDSSARAQGRIVVTVEVGQPVAPPSTQPSSPAQPSPSPKPPPASQASTSSPSPVREGARSGAQTAVSPPVGRSVSVENAYGVRVSAALVRLHALRPMLESIDRQTEILSGNLDAAVNEFDAIARLLGAIKPPRSRAGTHALLQRTCTMGARAVRMRQDGARSNDPTAALNAASAAAGALMMLDRANKELAEVK
jgi:hypothetical protein